MEFSNNIMHYKTYYYDIEKDMWIPFSCAKNPSDILFTDNTDLLRQLQDITTSENALRLKMIKAVNNVIGGLSSNASWDEIISSFDKLTNGIESMSVFNYTGDTQTYTVPVTATYQIECVGAGQKYSKGARVLGKIKLNANDVLQINVGGQFSTFNGGGKGGSVWHSASNSGGSYNGNVSGTNGCGASDVRLNGETLEDRIIVAGGGGGNGEDGGVWYSYNGSEVSDGAGHHTVYGYNKEASNDVLGQGSNYSSSVSSGVWGTGDSYPDRGTYSIRTTRGGGGGGYYGGKSGYAGTSYISTDFSETTTKILTQVGHGYVKITLIG